MRGGFDLELARAFVAQHGTPLERARLAALEQGTAPHDVPPELASLQNLDGGFPYELQAGHPSALNHTALALQWLQELHLTGSTTAGGAYAFLLSRQTRRGIWRESADLQSFSLPLWMDPESAAGDVYTTALCARTLLDHPDAGLEIDRAVAWLQTHQGRDGLLEGFKAPASWLAVPVFAHLLGHDARAARRLVAGLGAILSDEWTPAMLAGMLRSMLEAGYGLRTELVSRGWALLKTQQQPDGSFAPDEANESAADVTLMVLDVARRIGRSRTSPRAR